MFVIKTFVPDYSSKIYLPTRFVVGCADQAQFVGQSLINSGFSIDVEEVAQAPERSLEETQRAVNVLELLFQPAQGNA